MRRNCKFWDRNGSPNLGQTTKPHDSKKKKKKRKKKENLRIVDFTVPADHGVKIKESEKWDKCLHLDRDLNKTMQRECDSDTNYGWDTWNNPQKFDKGTGRLRNKRTGGDNPDDSIVKTDQKTEKSPEVLTRLATIQTPVRRYQLTMIWKPLKGVKKKEYRKFEEKQLKLKSSNLAFAFIFILLICEKLSVVCKYLCRIIEVILNAFIYGFQISFYT